MDIFDKLFAAKNPQPSGPVEFIVAGLGNPGKEYESTRHNAGFLAVDRIAAALGIRVDRLKFKSLCGEAVIEGRRVLFLKPATFMNLSGQAVTEAMSFYKIPAERVLILYDDISLDPGRLRIRRRGSDGGHNGMKNIIYLAGEDSFPRVKIGVGAKPHPDYNLADWVTSRFSDGERKALDGALEHTIDIVKLVVGGKIDEAMNRYNS
ncbi:MAG: aminoacyl-tRNA hydrolase [Oscillospiraceae bacterium]|nr:aminoacyl-tRNA hydrolase [Oscillospiraceae bacterium]